jgi:hypothetical protein
MTARGRLLAVVSLVALCACDDETIESHDLTVSAPLDSSMPPLDVALAQADDGFGPSYDFAFSCPRIAGTCVETFFQNFASCFHPAGHCQTGLHNNGSLGTWNDCASYIDTHEQNFGFAHDYRQDGHACLAWRTDTYQHTHPDEFCPPGVCTGIVDDGGLPSAWSIGGAAYDQHTGIFTCLDGTAVDIGNNYGDCPPVTELLNPLTSLCDGRGTTASCPPL